MSTPRELLDIALAANDAHLASVLPGLDAAIGAASGSIEHAGDDLQADEDAAAAGVAAATDEYQQYLIELQSAATAIGDHVNDVEPPPDSIALINAIAPISVTPNDPLTIIIPIGGTPDCSAADVQTAINDVLISLAAVTCSAIAVETAVNLLISQLIPALQAINAALTNGSIDSLKQAAEKTAEAIQLVRDFSPPVIDTAAEIATAVGTIDGAL